MSSFSDECDSESLNRAELNDGVRSAFHSQLLQNIACRPRLLMHIASKARLNVSQGAKLHF